MLVERGVFGAQNTAGRVTCRCARSDDFAFVRQGVTGAHRAQPCQVFDRTADHAALHRRHRFDDQAHGHGGSVPAAGDQFAKGGADGFVSVEVKILRVVLAGEGDNLFGGHKNRARLEG